MSTNNQPVYADTSDLIINKTYRCIKHGTTFHAVYEGPVTFPLDADSGYVRMVDEKGNTVRCIVPNICIFDL